MLALIEALDCPFGLERSAKLGGGAINEDRFLAIVHKSALGSDPTAGLSRMARALRMPEPMLAMLCGEIAEAEIVHFGYEGGAAALYKVYVEFPGRVRRGLAPGAPARAEIVHLAVKWRADDPGAAAVSRYVWPAAARGPAAIATRLAGLAPQAGRLASVRAALDLVEAARERCRPSEILFMEVEEDGSPRRSFDINFYPAGLPVRAVAGPVRGLAAAYGIAPALVEAFLSRVGPLQLGHLSGGIGRNGSDFATLYFGAAERKGAGRG
jgi:tryptophan halogenase